MPIKHLENYLHERKHLQTLPLHHLSDSRLGIDAAYYIQNVLEDPETREPLLAATGGLPLTLSTRIESDLRVLEKLHIKPVFVFPGLNPGKRQRFHYNQEYDAACRDRKEAWSKYEAGQEEAAQQMFAGRHGLNHWDLWRMVLRIFRNRNVEFIVAPYFAWAQLIYLQRHPKAYIHAIYGPTEALLYPGVDKLVTSLDLAATNATFQYLSKRSVMNELGVNEDQFMDIGILVGFDQNPTFPPTQHDQALKATLDMVKYYKSGHLAVSAFAEHPAVKAMQYPEQYARMRTMIKFSLVLASDGTVTPLPLASPTPPAHGHGHHQPTAADVPQDLHEVFTNRLPDEIYFYLSRGLVGPQVLNWLTSGLVQEPPPLDNGESNEYRRFVKEVITEGQTGPRPTALALVSSVCHNFWQKRQVTSQLWFDPPNPPNQNKAIQHNSTQTMQLAERVSGWNVPATIVEEELRRQNSSTIDFALCLGATATERQAIRTKTKPNPQSHLDKKDEIVANVIWRFLELRGFLITSHTHSHLARAMYNAIRNARVNDKFQEPLYLFLELVRAGVMHGHLWTIGASSGGPSFGTAEEKSSMLLVMRVLSIVPLGFKAQAWSAPLSRELLVFNSFVRSLTRALRTLLETTSLNMLLRHDARRHPRDDLLDIALSLPFQTEANTGFGVLAKVYLDALIYMNNHQRVTDPNAEGVKEMKETALDLCVDSFDCCKYPRQEVERGFRFWDVCLTAMRQLHSESNVHREVIDQFEAAEAWLAPMRP